MNAAPSAGAAASGPRADRHHILTMKPAIPDLVRQKLDELPLATGCYLMHGARNEVLYVGKATVLRQRVRSYFTPSQASDPKVEMLVPEVRDITWWITHSELEALTLENNLIKEHQPPFNVRLKDDKTYPYLKINWQDPFPRVEVTRIMRRDGARYFGPYTNARNIYRTLEGIRRIFPYLDCDRTITGQDERPCLYYHLKMCGGPCIGAQSSEEYRQGLRQMMRFLRGDAAPVLSLLDERMRKAAANLDFERAALIRDRMKAARRIVNQQRIIGTTPDDEDCVATASDPDTRDTVVQIMFVRKGRLIGREHFLLTGQERASRKGRETAPGNLIGAFLQQYYAEAAFIPPTVLVQAMPDQEELLARYLTSLRGRKVRLAVPLRGAKRKLMELAHANAREYLRVRQATWQTEAHRQTQALAELQEALDLPRPPARMECYDISTLQGTHTVGAMVVFVRGVPRKREYRRFRIQGRGAQGAPDDTASMREMLERRFRRAAAKSPENGRGTRSTWHLLPDLVIVDGGKGQLRQAVEVLRAHSLLHVIPVIGLAKRHEEIFQPGQREPLRLPPDSQGLYLLQRIRDEAHRFGVTFHRTLRGKAMTRTLLDDVPGIGPARRQRLLAWCEGDLERLREAEPMDLVRIPGMNRKVVQALREHLATTVTNRS